MKTNKKLLVLGMSALMLPLAVACGGGGSKTPTDDSCKLEYPVRELDAPLANGVYSYADASYEQKAEITAALEGYAMRNHLAGIPLYDDAGLVQMSQRLTVPTTNYITNYGFGSGEGTITGTMMYDGEINEPVNEWKSYFHSWTSVDTGTFQAWNAEGSDVSDRAGMVTSSYYGVQMNAEKTGFDWVPSLAKEMPIMLSSAGGTPVDRAHSTQASSRFWRVKLKTTYVDPSDGQEKPIVYATASQKNAAFNGRALRLEDYMTPFKMMLNNNLKRATDIGTDASGFVGVYEYANGTHSEDAWKKSVGIKLNTAEQAIDFEFITAKNDYYAMYNLASSLFSPVPEEFITAVGGIKNYGVIGSSTNPALNIDNVLSIGPYVPVSWEKNKEIVYRSSNNFFERDQYHYDGMTEVVLKDSTEAYKAFLKNELDYVEIPSDYIDTHKNDPKVYTTEGSTVIKINVNTTTKCEWEYFFGTKGTMYQHAKSDFWNVKPIMSNKNFLDGVYFSINRDELARITGRNAAMGFLSNGYMSDPETNTPYRNTAAGQKAISDYAGSTVATNGYSKSIAESFFVDAAEELLASGAYKPRQTITLNYIFRYQDTIDKLGSYLKGYIETTFNEAMSANGIELALNLKLEVAGPTYTDCYTRMDRGEYDFADGAISGNVLNPLEFMNVICSDSLSQGFCLNWGHPTAMMNYDDPIVYDGKSWSYNALFAAGTGTAVVKDGVNVPAVDQSLTEKPHAEEFDGEECAVFVLDINQQYDPITDDPTIIFRTPGAEEEQVIFIGDSGFAHYAGYYANGLKYDINEDERYAKIYYPLSKLNAVIKQAGESVKKSDGPYNLTELQFQAQFTYIIAGRDTTKTFVWNVSIESVGANPYIA